MPYKDADDNLMQRSVFSGVNKNSIDPNEALRHSVPALSNLLDGQEVIKIDSRPEFFRNMNNLSITIQDQTSMTINSGSFKKLVDNKYIPQHIS